MVPRQKLHGRQMGRLVFSQVTVEEAEAQEGEMTQVTRQEESDRPGPGDLRMGLPSHPSQGRDWRHTEGGLPWLPAHQQSTKLPASKAELPWHCASSFQLTHRPHSYLMHLCLNWPRPLMGTGQPAPQGSVYVVLLGPPEPCLSQSNREKRSLLPVNMQIPANPTAYDLETGARQAAGVRNKPCRGQKGVGKRGTARKA